MQGHTFSSFYIYRSLLINKPRINEVFVPDIYIIPDILWKSEKRFEVSAFEGSLFSGLISGSCYILTYFRRFAIPFSRGLYFRKFTEDFPRGLYLV